MTLEVALLLATMVGQTVGIVARLMPGSILPNKIIPKLVLFTNIAANVVLVAQKFVESIGLVAPGVAWWAGDDGTFALAGLGFLKGFGVFIGSAVLGYAQLALQRLVHEKGIKPVLTNGSSGTY